MSASTVRRVTTQPTVPVVGEATGGPSAPYLRSATEVAADTGADLVRGLTHR
ncbi:hypothetical protein [Blastococcus sp. URHD0036]|uniref:hypothetical protein n=1 Tax=Blastococcus sp. URHD0036 TaxID=1380356 RepID=UPI0012DC3E8A|nr:hypothetical protein [Blastococcus sp. URHD0036]